jgi:hypothetical protein
MKNTATSWLQRGALVLLLSAAACAPDAREEAGPLASGAQAASAERTSSPAEVIIVVPVGAGGQGVGEAERLELRPVLMSDLQR